MSIRLSVRTFILLVALVLLHAQRGAAQTCPCSIWTTSTTPGPVELDPNALELGVKFQSDVSGFISGVRFYKYAQNTGTHVGNLWAAGGQLLGTVTFTNETASGWQTATFASPIAIAANTTYVASYHTNAGFYAANAPTLASAVNTPPLHALASGSSGGNGVYVYQTTSAFPTQTYQSSNYWVDVVFTTGGADTTPPTVTAVAPVNGATSVSTTTTVTATFSEAMQTASISTSTMLLTGPGNTPVAASVTYSPTTLMATLTPSAALATGTTYTATVKGGAGGVADAAGNAMAADRSWTFTTASPGVCPCSIWTSTTTPGSIENDPAAVELGLKFQSDTSGFVTGLRFYKYAQNSGTHVGNLWTASGQLLATVTFTNETVSGWQSASFTTPVAVSAGTTYVISYHTNTGFYAVNGPTLTSAIDNPPLHALASGASGGNGVYVYGASAFPTQSYQASNYWVDPIFTTSVDTTPPTVTANTPSNGASGVSPTATVTATFSEAMQAGSISTATMLLTGPGNTAVAATVSYNTATLTATLTPSAPLFASSSYTATVKGGTSGVKDAAGNALASDVSWTFTTMAGSTLPVVSSVTPPPGAINVPISSAATVTFSEPMNAATLTSGIKMFDATSSPVSATVTYDAATLTATLTPAASLANNASYSVTVKGGAGGVTDASGNPLASDFSWSFLTAQQACPCSIWTLSTTPGPMLNDANAVELGLKFQSDVAGFVTGVRFYKYAQNTGAHVGNLWSASGQLLATVTFSNETTSGWQQASFSPPVQIAANTTYVVSYHTNSGFYAVNAPTLTAAVDNPPLHALASAASGGNGVYIYGASAFPSQSFGDTNYWVDVVLSTGSIDTTPPTVTSTSPASGETGVATVETVAATFSEAISTSTVNGTTFQLRTSTNTQVPATVSYNASTLTATLTPTSALASGSTYTAILTSGITDLAGNPLSSPPTWSFSTQPSTVPPTQGAGGPILVVTSSSNPFTTYYNEILRAEGLNEFATVALTSVTTSTLAGYDVVILGEQSLTSTQVTMFTNWVKSGGKLIALRPDTKLASLLGLTSVGASLTNGYQKIDTTQAPGTGIVSQTMQYHGPADEYNLNGARAVATLYSDATHATSFPAVTLNAVGTSGGQAAAFTYDLAKSVVYTRQGNPAWAGQARDGDPDNGNPPVIRSDDMFYGASVSDPQPDWVDRSKIAIPQADEQQRLLANLILLMESGARPLPRFWYFPRGFKAVIVMTGDDHGVGGTLGRMNQYAASSPAGCNVANWECIRSSSYIYAYTPISNTQVASLIAQGFDIGVHLQLDQSTQYSCGPNFTSSTLTTAYTTQLAQFKSAFPSAGSPVTHRMHCVMWSDWSTQPTVELSKGIRLDTNYYYWPPAWVNDTPGLFTGSGMPMRFATTNGTLIDVYQATTQMTDESGQSYPLHIDTLLNNALGSTGYYGAFTANMHTDQAASSSSDAILSSAAAHNVPIVSAKQMLTWLDARNGSSFGPIAWNGNTLAFSIIAAANAVGLQVMVPATAGSLTLAGITLNGAPVSYTTQTIKGVSYAFVTVAAGVYNATYQL